MSINLDPAISDPRSSNQCSLVSIDAMYSQLQMQTSCIGLYGIKSKKTIVNETHYIKSIIKNSHFKISPLNFLKLQRHQCYRWQMLIVSSFKTIFFFELTFMSHLCSWNKITNYQKSRKKMYHKMSIHS